MVHVPSIQTVTQGKYNVVHGIKILRAGGYTCTEVKSFSKQIFPSYIMSHVQSYSTLVAVYSSLSPPIVGRLHAV